MPYCLECGSKLIYDRSTRQYVCESCGSTYTSQELLVARERMQASKFENERKKRERNEYLEWWLSAKQSR